MIEILNNFKVGGYVMYRLISSKYSHVSKMWERYLYCILLGKDRSPLLLFWIYRLFWRFLKICRYRLAFTACLMNLPYLKSGPWPFWASDSRYLFDAINPGGQCASIQLRIDHTSLRWTPNAISVGFQFLLLALTTNLRRSFSWSLIQILDRMVFHRRYT